jgi:hypothetical protein
MKKILLFLFLILATDFAYSQSGKSKTREVYINGKSKPRAPANLVLTSINFNDGVTDSNDILDAGEEGEITFSLINNGSGDAVNLLIELKPLNYLSEAVASRKVLVERLSVGNEVVVTIPLAAPADLENGKLEFEIKIKEGNGFHADPVNISFMAQKFKTPLLSIADYQFSTDQGGNIRLGQLVYLTFIVQNRGQGEATDISVSFKTPENVFPAAESKFLISTLRPNESKKLTFEFFANKLYQHPEIQIDAWVTEATGKYGESRVLTVSLDQKLNVNPTVEIDGKVLAPIPIAEVSLLSDVDRDIPVGNQIRENTYALVIGNEDYGTYQEGLQKDQDVKFAQNDALVFSQYLVKTLGVPEKQVFTVRNATKAQMTRQIERVVELVKLTKNSQLIFYYAGHGLPDRETNEGYIIPVDVTASNIRAGLNLKDMYSMLASAKAGKTIVLLDACFSGGGRGENGLLSARTVKVKPKGPIMEGNIVAYTATSGTEVSLPLPGESHGLFTYFLLKKLKETKGTISLIELKNYLEFEVPKTSLIENSIKQMPEVLIAPTIGNEWETWTF